MTAHHAHACPELPAWTENLKLQATSPLPGRTGHCPSRQDGCRARQLPGARKCASASPALASIRSVILPPTRSRTCQQYRASQEQHDLQPAAARPTDRCRAEMPHSKHSLLSARPAAGKYSHAAERVGWLDSTGQWRHGSRSCAERDDLSAYIASRWVDDQPANIRHRSAWPQPHQLALPACSRAGSGSVTRRADGPG